MKLQLLTTAIIMTFVSPVTFAHHPAADIVDPEIYAMIDENVSDTPHADLVFDEMGRDASDTGDSMESRDNFDAPMVSRDEMGTENQTHNENGEVAADLRGPLEQARNEDGTNAGDEVDTFDLLDNVSASLSE